VNHRPQLQIVAPEATPEETAAVVAALEQFMRDHVPVFVEANEPEVSPWKRAALLEGIARQPEHPAAWL
jgi:hypothetical protein